MIAISPDGNSACVACENASRVSQYSINLRTGRLTPKSPATVAAASGSEAVAVGPAADISARLIAPRSVANGGELVYTIAVTNEGPSDAWQVTLTDALPATVQFQGASAAAVTCSPPSADASGTTVSCQLGELKDGVSERVQIRATAPGSAGAIIDAARVISVTPDPRTGNNTTNVTTKVS